MPRSRSTPAGVAERLQKFLAQRGLGSRRGVEEWIRAQRLTVNGRIAELGQKVTEADDIRLDGRPIKARASAVAQAFMFNRSPGDPLRESTAERTALIERLPKHAGRRFVAVSPMPGIDGGLELVTSDGALAARLQRAIHKLPCEFTARVKGLLGPDQLAGIRSGRLDRPARLTVDSLSSSDADLEGSNRWYAIVTRGASGKDIRQLFERQGALVSRVLRVSIGSLKLDKALSRGQFRQLEEPDIDALLNPPAPESAGP
ncbi:MAG TPA: S4 domain-containing protein [Steroidobacteraceae bacterium]|jgi:23S rRNA pseudouridine2605 synthase|nr:S4 domain-containing protein [Steroidobacteraceae bacterium]